MTLLDKEIHDKLLTVFLKQRLAESMLAEVMDEIKESNDILRELQRKRWLSNDGT